MEHLAVPALNGIRWGIRCGEISINNSARNVRAKIYGPATDFLYRVHEVVRRLALQHIAINAGAQRLGDILIFIVLREKYDFGLRRGFLQFASSVDTIQDGHADIDDGDVRLRLLYRAQSFLAVRGLADNLKSLLFQ